MMDRIRRTAHSADRPAVGRVVQSEPFDRWRDYPADGLTPGQLSAILRAADAGSVEQAMALYEQMEEKDPHLYSVANTRRLALTSLNWRIASAAEVRDGVDRAAADEAAAYVGEVLAELDRFDEVLQHLSLALGRNIAVAENVWEVRGDELRLIDIVPVGFDRMTFDEMGRPRVLTRDEPIRGIELPPHKFVVHTPHSVSGHAMRGGLLRVSALAYLGKQFTVKDWLMYAEVFGMPVRVARYDPSASVEEKRELLRMLETLGADAVGIFSKAVELEFLEAGRGSSPPPYDKLCGYLNRELSKAWLGQTLTVETVGSTVSLAATQVHNEVRMDLRQDDLAKEARTVRRDILRPIVRLRFGPEAPVPYFRRVFEQPRDLRELADVLNVAVNELKMAVPSEWAHEVLGVPAARAEQAVLSGKGK